MSILAWDDSDAQEKKRIEGITSHSPPRPSSFSFSSPCIFLSPSSFYSAYKYARIKVE